MMRFLLSLLLLVSALLSAAAQGSGEPDWSLIRYSYIQNNLKIPASPAATSFTRYDNNYSLSYYTGAANVSLPLCEIGDAGLNMPITLNYATTGVRVDDLPGWVGLGWNITAGGVINRTVVGHPDMASNYHNANSNWPNEPTSNPDKIAERKFLDDVAEGSIETQPDVYHFNFAGYSGSFVIKKDYGVIFDTEQYLTLGSGPGNGFTITDAAGFIYKFTATETTSYNYETVSDDGPTWIFDFTSAWYLTEIQHPNAAEGKIVLGYADIDGTSGYQDKLVGLEALTSYHYSYYNTTPPMCCGSSAGSTTGSFTLQKISHRQIISNISFFKNNVKRQELLFNVSNYGSPNFYNAYKINSITRYDYSNTTAAPQKTVNFYYSAGSHNRNVLDSVKIVGRDLVSMPAYKFGYESGSLPNPFGTGTDFWGFANGSSGGLIQPLCSITGSGNSTRTASFSQAKAATLNKITYPTGGYTKYIYEPHTVAPFTLTNQCSQTYTEAGGVRVKRIEHYSANNVLANAREYKYVLSDGVQSSGKSLHLMEYAFTNGYNHEPTFACIPGECSSDNYSCYSTTLTPNAIQTYNYFESSHVGYSRVEEILVPISGAGTSGKTVYEFFNVDYSNSGYQRNGELLYSTIYDASGSIVEKTSNTYYLDGNSPTTNTYRKMTAEPEGNQSNYTRLCYTGTGYVWLLPFECLSGYPTCVQSYIFETRLIRRSRTFKTKYNFLSSRKIDSYTYEGGTQRITTKTLNYEYNYAYAMAPTKISITNSDNKLHELRYTYPSTTNQPDLFNKYMRAMPIQTERYVGGIKVYGYKIIYANFGGNLKPSLVQEAYGTSTTYVNKEELTAYDAAGNVLEARRTHGQEDAYLWWGDQLRMSAYFQNAKQSEVLYAGFELPTTNDGGWTTNATYFQYVVKGGAGGNGYYYGTTQLEQSKNVPLGKYLLSYHTSNPAGTTLSAKSGTSMSVLSQKTIAGAFANGFFLVEAVINFTAGTGGLAGLRLNFSTTTKIDEVRLHPADALCQTFAYDKTSSLLLSSGDPAGVPMRYEYDGLNRLVGALNMDNHYLQTLEYQYQQFPTPGVPVNAQRTRTVLTGGITSPATVNGLSADLVIPAFSFVDGLGRPLQSTQVAESAAGKDIVGFHTYDLYGRQTKQYLPYTATTNGGAYRTAAGTEQVSFYTSLYPPDANRAFTEYELEASPLARVLKERPPGNAFYTHPIETSYSTNISSSEVRNFTAANGWYAANTLYKISVKDENGSTTHTYTDRLGRTVMVNAAGARTYYLYDDFGNVKQIIQPEAAERGHSTPANTNTTALVKDNSFEYEYDATTGLMTSKRMPGNTAKTLYYYDRLDRLVLQKDPLGVQTFTKYDIQGRVILSGRYTGTATPTGSEALYEAVTSTGHFYTTSLSFPTSGLEIYTVNYYDDYDFDDNNVDNVSYTAPPGVVSAYYPAAAHLLVRGKMTGSKVAILPPGGSAPTVYTTTYPFYDRYGRVIQTSGANHLTGQETVWNQYDFPGRLLRTRRQHTGTVEGVAQSWTINERFTYDAGGRLLDTYHQIGDVAGDEKLLSRQSYTELEQVDKKRLAATSLAGTTWNQTLNYTYNIRGWLTRINDPTVCSASGETADLFALGLHYADNNQQITNTPQYNGNISWMDWRVGVNCQVSGAARNRSAYVFSYDGRNQLTQAKYTEYAGTGTVTSNTDRYTVNGIMYDLNGNLKNITRQGHTGSTYGAIDNLSLTYNTALFNRLSNVADASLTTKGHTAPSTAAQAYTYDAAGNLTVDNSKGMTSVLYNYLNLPRRINYSSGHWIDITYDAAGNKLRQADDADNIRNYAGVIDYAGGSVEAINHSEGRAKRTGSTWTYEYVIKDHLGNTRVLFTDTNNDGAPEMKEEYHYYPFGMRMDGWPVGTGNYRYQYNGKEVNTDFGLHWVDYGARWYDAGIGRFMTVDRFAEKYNPLSSYQYAANNPVRFIDVNGDSIDVFAPDGTHLYTYDDGKEEVTGFYFQSENENKNGEVSYSNGIAFSYNDESDDRASALAGEMEFKVINDNDINTFMTKSAIDNVTDKWNFAWNESHNGKLDFWAEYGDDIPSNTLFITNSKGGGTVAYNDKDFGNYLWGQAMSRLGFSVGESLHAAHANNILFSRRQHGKNVGFFDSPGDQRAILNGFEHFKESGYPREKFKPKFPTYRW